MGRIVQILGTLSYGDAIGNHVIAIHRGLLEKGIQAEIYAESIDERIGRDAKPLSGYQPREEDTILYHLSYGTPLNRSVCDYPGRLIINYHNITPGDFFRPYNKIMADQCDGAYRDLDYMKASADLVIGDSRYNLSAMKERGYTCPLISVPIVMDYGDYEKKPNEELIRRLKDGETKNVLFVGRIAPNKCQQYVIEDFYDYHRYLEPNSRLILVGGVGGNTNYYLRLKAYIKKLHLEEAVIFPGHIPFEDILAYYRAADAFLCESEHEGFCVPLIEAMYFHVPIIARDTSAVGETLGEAGYLFRERNSAKTARVLDLVIRDGEIRRAIIQGQDQRLMAFDREATLRKFLEVIQ